LLTHNKLVEFIARNYEADPLGRWYFQNGPQRVFVELQATPWVWRLDAQYRITAHTGRSVQAQACLLDETGRLYLHTECGLGLVHTMDVHIAAQAIESGHWHITDVMQVDLPQLFGYVQRPAP
jgi:hypothetical protein